MDQAHLVRGYPAQSDFCEGRESLWGSFSLYKMLRHDVPGPHIDGMMLEIWKPGGVRLTLKVVQSWHEPLMPVHSPEGMEKIMGKHSQMGILRRDADAPRENRASF